VLGLEKAGMLETDVGQLGEKVVDKGEPPSVGAYRLVVVHPQDVIGRTGLWP
jgi:hypothetical protein